MLGSLTRDWGIISFSAWGASVTTGAAGAESELPPVPIETGKKCKMTIEALKNIRKINK
jgi:hypothetical protein